MRKETNKMTDSTKTTNHSRPKADSTNNQLSIINNQCKGPILPVPAGNSGVIYAKNNTKNSKKIQKKDVLIPTFLYFFPALLCKTNPISLPKMSMRSEDPSQADKTLQISPDFTLKKCIFLITFSTLFPSFSITFTRFSALFVTFCKYLKTTHLTPYTTKTYINICPKLPFKRGIYPQSFWREKMQNEPNLKTLTN
jgi:hypothetical protein